MNPQNPILATGIEGLLSEEGSDRRSGVLSWLSAAVALCDSQATKYLLGKALDENVPVLQAKEVILQSYLFCGFPAAIEGLIVLNRVLHDRHIPDDNYTETRNSQEMYQDGIDLCRIVYGKNYSKLLNNMSHLSSDISQWMIAEGYGKVLSRHILSLKERELAVIAALTVLRRERQLVSHLRGAVHAGAGKSEIAWIMSGLETLAGKDTVSFGLRVLQETLH